MFADVVFPRKLPALTYRLPEDAPRDLVGRIVQAPLGQRTAAGVIIAQFPDIEAVKKISASMPDDSHLKTVQAIGSRFWSPPGIRLIEWLADYYLAPIGLVLKSCFFDDIIAEPGAIRSTPRHQAIREPACEPISAEELPALTSVIESIKGTSYQSFLYHAPPAAGERPFVHELLTRVVSNTTGIIILVPEHHDLDYYAETLRNEAAGRFVALHAGMSPNRRGHALRRLQSGEADILLGTRSAILAPMPKVSLILVAEEQNASYKAEEGIRYHGRDVAVMRGYLENATVVLASSCPSVESAWNSRNGKYRLLDCHQANRGDRRRPEIRVVPPPAQKKQHRLHLADEVIRAVRGYLKTGGPVLFLINRKGYSLLQCEACGEIVRCGKCGTPVVFHKSEGRLECRHCMSRPPLPEQCPTCSAVAFHELGAGTERIRDELYDVFGQNPTILEKDGPRTENVQGSGDAALVVGTAYALRASLRRHYGAVVLLSIDAALSQPDFRAHERTLQDIVQALQLIRPGGTMFIQTRNIREPLLRYISRLDFGGFLAYELDHRRVLNFPPFSRMIRISIHCRSSKNVLRSLSGMLKSQYIPGVEILGPVELPSDMKGFSHCVQLLVKASDRKAAASCARPIQDLFEQSRQIRVIADVDPYRI